MLLRRSVRLRYRRVELLPGPGIDRVSQLNMGISDDMSAVVSSTKLKLRQPSQSPS
jgi:hypothetical protein